MLRSQVGPLAVAALLFLGVTQCHGAEAPATRVVFFGDSITGWFGPTDWPALVGKQRPGIQVCNNGVPGRTTVDGLAQLDGVLGYASLGGRVSDVVILLGVNDLMGLHADPYDTAERLRQIAQRVRESGAREWILTLTPAIKIPLHRELGAWAFSRDVSNWLLMLNGVGPVYKVADVRDEFARRVLWSSCSTDGLHPTGLACRQVIADYVAAMLP